VLPTRPTCCGFVFVKTEDIPTRGVRGRERERITCVRGKAILQSFRTYVFGTSQDPIITTTVSAEPVAYNT